MENAGTGKQIASTKWETGSRHQPILGKHDGYHRHPVQPFASSVMEKGERSKRIKIIPRRKAGLDAKPEIGK
jgi:hypothetical protein